MASYTNRRGEKIEVSEEHIETAIELKVELQKMSPSGTCSWAQHKRMMAKEGFEDSDSCESYRQLVKKEQKKRGELPSAKKHVEMLADKKLESIKESIGEMYIAKRQKQNANRELNKVKRLLADNMMFVEEALEELGQVSFDSKYKKLKRLEESDSNQMLVVASDWHIGLLQETYSYSIANKRMKRFAQNIIRDAKRYNSTSVEVANVGDMVEGAYMRPHQAYDLEFDYSTQVVKASEIIMDFLLTLSEELNVTYLGGIIGNHGRMYDKGKTIDGDNVENIIDAFVKKFIKDSENERIELKDSKETNFSLKTELGGKKFKLVHGDLIGKNGKEKVSKFISSDNEFYDVLVYGHFHSFSNVEENHGRESIGVGCLQGTTNFSKQLGYDTYPSQTIIIVEDGEIFPKKIYLKDL